MGRKQLPEVSRAAAPSTAAPSSTALPATAGRSWSDPLLVGGFFCLVFWLGCYIIVDGDLWWHIRTGELIWQRGAIPAYDWFTYTNPDSRWIDLHWGFQLLVAGLWNTGGAALITLVKCALAVATFGLLWLSGPPRKSVGFAVAFWIPPLLFFAGRYQERPEMLSLLFLAAQLFILTRAERQPRSLWLLPLVMIAWVNVQGIFILGLLVQAAYVTAWLLQPAADFALRTEQRDLPLVRAALRWPLLGSSVLMPLACLVNPYGWEGFLFPFLLRTRIEGDNRAFFQQFSGEFLGVSEFIERYGYGAVFSNLSTLTMLALIFLAVASFGILLSLRRVCLFRLFIFCGFTYLAWLANRNGVLLAVVGGYVVYHNFAEIAVRAPTMLVEPRWLRPLLGVALVAIAVSAPTGVLSWARGAGPYTVQPRPFGLGISPTLAFGACEFLRRPDLPRRVYAQHLGQASVYILTNGPDGKVFADPRLEVNTPDTLARYQRIEQLLLEQDPQAERELLRNIPADASGVPQLPALVWDIRTLAIQLELLTALAEHPRWRCVFADEAALVFVSTAQAEAAGWKTLDLAPLVREARLMAAVRN